MKTKRLIFVVLAMALAFYASAQIELGNKKEEKPKDIRITSDISLSFPYALKVGMNYSRNWFTMGVDAGVLYGDLKIGVRPFIFERGQITVNAAYSMYAELSPATGVIIDFLFIKNLKIDAGILYNYDNDFVMPVINIGYAFNLYNQQKQK